MVLSTLVGAAAAATGTFAVDTPTGRYDIAAWEPPPSYQLPRSDRTCAIGVAWTAAGVVATPRHCPSAVTEGAVDAVRSWKVVQPVGVGTAQELGEVWFVYPFEAPGRPRVLVRQSHDRVWTLPDGVDPAPYQIRAWSFLIYPAEAHGADRPDVRCDVAVEADLEGYASNVRVTGCVPPFTEATRNAVADWRFTPPLVDGEEIPTSIGFAVTYSAAPPAQEGYRPSDQSRSLWENGQFEALSHEERLWFIKAELLGPTTLGDLGPGHVVVSLPPAPDLAGRVPYQFFRRNERSHTPVRPLPDHQPVLLLGLVDHEAVEVYELALPPVDALPDGVDHAECPLLVQVDGSRQVFSWAERGCDASIQQAALQNADQWLLAFASGHDDPAVRLRIHATIVVDRSGSTVTFPADELRTPLAAAPAGVHSHAPPRPVTRIPPKVPRNVELPSGSCELDVLVGTNGRAREVVVTSCPPGFEDAAEKAVRRWMWDPAEVDGRPVDAQAPVTIRFQP